MKKIVIALLLYTLSIMCFALDAPGNGHWISLGTPNKIHMGTEGAFYLQGDNQGTCAATKPVYFRIDMSKPYFDQLYSWLLLMSAQKKPLDCVVVSGCGSTQVWVEYCRGPL